MTIDASQCRAARAFLGITQDDLSTASRVAKRTIADFETGKRAPYPRTLNDIQSALEGAGIEFLPDNGVRLRRQAA